MKKISVLTFVFLIGIQTIFFQACSSTGMPRGESFSTDGLDITARGAIGGLETATGPMFTGDGGKNIRLAIHAPEVHGDVPLHLPIYIQGLLNSNFNKYSAINLIDRQNLNRIIAEQNLAASGKFSEKDFIQIGNLANAQFYLFGTIQKLSGSRYSLQLSVTESSTGVRKATFLKEGTLAQFEGRATLLNEATTELLEKLGVKLTDAGRQSLLAGNISTVQAQTGLARGITAQAGGSEVEALFNFAQAITFDPTQIEALSRLNTLSTTISGGTISQRIVNDIQARDRWIEAFKETTRFFNDHPPFEIIFDPNLIQIGETDYKKRTATLGMRISLESSKAGFDALNALLEGLEKTGRRNAWGFSGWPLMDISPRTSGTVVFGGKGPFSYKVDVALINENNKTISKSSITLITRQIKFASGAKVITPLSCVDDTVKFANVKAEDLTPTLTIVILAVNGISSRDLSASGYMRIEPGDLKKIEKERQEIKTFTGHRDSVTSVAFSPDGKQIISGSNDRTIKLWDTGTGHEIRTFSGHMGVVSSVAFSPDGKQILSGAMDSATKLWDISTGREIRTFSSSGYHATSVVFSPDGKQILSGFGNRIIQLWDISTGREIRTFSGHMGVVSSVVFSPDGKQILSGTTDGTIKLWNVSAGHEIRTLSGHKFGVTSVAFSPDGKQIISGSNDRTIRLWDVATGREIRTFLGHVDNVTSVAFGPDGKQIISGARDSTTKLWDANTGREIRTFSGHIDVVTSIAFSPDGKQIISGSNDRTIKLWDVATGKIIRTIGTE
ncbi:MAG: WD40 repeat domain-containing protein [Spirochaetaceae bacterium]|nr:WD40 repeat domain-containing protein [Spirochaetaceae bacterium]